MSKATMSLLIFIYASLAAFNCWLFFSAGSAWSLVAFGFFAFAAGFEAGGLIHAIEDERRQRNS